MPAATGDRGPVEATALGNVLIQARASGDVASLSEIRDIVRKSEAITEYQPMNSSAWNDAWQKFQAVCQ